MIIDDLPLRLFKNKSKLQSLNFNRFINNNYYVRKRLRKQFYKIFKERCAEIDCVYPKPPVKIIYKVFRPDNTADISNMCVVIDKFAQDAMKLCGILPNDNPDFVKEIKYKDGGIDPIHPRVMMTIETLNINVEDFNMKDLLKTCHCPSCGHDFIDLDDLLSKFETKLSNGMTVIDVLKITNPEHVEKLRLALYGLQN